jgi:hypothetical protein
MSARPDFDNFLQVGKFFWHQSFLRLVEKKRNEKGTIGV